jgi:hypothetical protein
MMARIAAFGAGAFIILVGSLFTLGAVLLCPIGILLVWWFVRRRGRRLSRLGAWVAATSTCAVVFVSAILVGFALMPEGSFSEVMSAAETAEPAGPEWLQRMAPQSREATPIDEFMSSKPVTVYFGIIGGVLPVLIMGCIAGSIGWGAALLMGFGVAGYWPFRGDSDARPAEWPEEWQGSS